MLVPGLGLGLGISCMVGICLEDARNTVTSTTRILHGLGFRVTVQTRISEPESISPSDGIRAVPRWRRAGGAPVTLASWKACNGHVISGNYEHYILM